MEKGIWILSEWTEFVFQIEDAKRQVAFWKAITQFGERTEEPEGVTAEEKEYFEKEVRPCLDWQRTKNLKVKPEELEEYLCSRKGQ